MASEGFTFTHKLSGGFHIIDAWVAHLPQEENEIGFLMWDGDDDGRIEDLYVTPEFRRQGLATRMWFEAVNIANRNYLSRPAHSETRTPSGDAWCRTMPNFFETEGIIESYTD